MRYYVTIYSVYARLRQV